MRMVGHELVIKTETGLTIKMPQTHDIKTGDKVLVAYDFIEAKYINVSREVIDARFKEIDVLEPISLCDIGEDDDSDILDSGALRTEGDGFWEFWDSEF
jgi:hypothetical protein